MCLETLFSDPTVCEVRSEISNIDDLDCDYESNIAMIRWNKFTKAGRPPPCITIVHTPAFLMDPNLTDNFSENEGKTNASASNPDSCPLKVRTDPEFQSGEPISQDRDLKFIEGCFARPEKNWMDSFMVKDVLYIYTPAIFLGLVLLWLFYLLYKLKNKTYIHHVTQIKSSKNVHVQDGAPQNMQVKKRRGQHAETSL